jgi:hypothetical protein
MLGLNVNCPIQVDNALPVLAANRLQLTNLSMLPASRHGSRIAHGQSLGYGLLGGGCGDSVYLKRLGNRVVHYELR